jgi:hypothetical protein
MFHFIPGSNIGRLKPYVLPDLASITMHMFEKSVAAREDS